MSVEPFVEPSNTRVSLGARASVGGYMVVVLWLTSPPSQILSSKKFFSEEEVRVEERAEEPLLEKVRAEDRTLEGPMGTS